jgi:pimeloyl-ACP methyl ester carboxylesterase
MIATPDFTRRMIAVPGGEIAVLDFGDANRPVDVIFSNGNGFNALCHRQALAPLGARMRIIAADQRGHGHTRMPVHPEGRTSWWDLAPDLVALMDGLALDRPVVLAGHSMGGTISLMAAQTVGARARAVVAFDPVLNSRPQTPADFTDHLKGLIAGTLRRRRVFDSRDQVMASYKGRGVFATWPDEVLADYVTDGFRDAAQGVELACSPEWEASNYAAQAQDGRGLLIAAALPVQVFKAGIQSTCNVEADDPAVVANPRLRMETVEGATHCLPMERPDVVQRALIAAVEGVG